MSTLGTSERPLRVAIVGSGPAGFYAAEALTRGETHTIVALIDRLPAPYGLVRYGVAPDHPKIKNVIKVYEKTIAKENVSFIGNVIVGKDVSVDDLKKMFSDAEGILFVSNEENFNQMLENKSYENLFVDRNNGDFGHLSAQPRQGGR